MQLLQEILSEFVCCMTATFVLIVCVCVLPNQTGVTCQPADWLSGCLAYWLPADGFSPFLEAKGKLKTKHNYTVFSWLTLMREEREERRIEKDKGMQCFPEKWSVSGWKYCKNVCAETLKVWIGLKIGALMKKKKKDKFFLFQRYLTLNKKGSKMSNRHFCRICNATEFLQFWI